MRYKRTRSKVQSAKTRFRRSAKWIRFRKHMKSKQRVCAVTGKPLGPTAALHHLDLREENYDNIDDESKFIYLSHTAHEMIHWLIGPKGNCDWKTRLKNIERILWEMDEINHNVCGQKYTEDGCQPVEEYSRT